MQRMELHVGLHSGYRMWWSTITPTVAGHLKVLTPPDFFRDLDAPWQSGEPLGGHWDLWPIDNPARPHPLKEVNELTREVHITTRTLGVALASLQVDDDKRTGWLWVEVFLSETEPAQHGGTLCEDWASILTKAKNDASQEAVLRLNFSGSLPAEIAAFKCRKKLVTSDMLLEVRARH